MVEVFCAPRLVRLTWCVTDSTDAAHTPPVLVIVAVDQAAQTTTVLVSPQLRRLQISRIHGWQFQIRSRSTFAQASLALSLLARIRHACHAALLHTRILHDLVAAEASLVIAAVRWR